MSLSKEDLKVTDKFVVQTGAIFKIVNNNIRAVGLAVLSLFLVIVAWQVINSYKEDRAKAASGEYFTAKKAIHDILDKTLKTDTAWESKIQTDVTKLELVAKKHSGSIISFQGYQELGNIFFEKGNYDKASNYFSEALLSAPNDVFKAITLNQLAFSYENLKKSDEAIASFKKILDLKDKSLRTEALMGLARNYKVKNDKQKAQENYDLVIKENPNSQISKIAELQKNQL